MQTFGENSYFPNDDIPKNPRSTQSQGKSNLFNAKITFKPQFFETNLTQKKYKGHQIILSTRSQLPQISIAPPLRKKIEKNVMQATKKDAYIFITKQTNEYAEENKFIIDDISYATEEAIEENYYQLNKYPLLLVTSTLGEGSMNDFDNPLDLENEFSLMSNLCKSCRIGSSTFFSQYSPFQKANTDFSTINQEISDMDEMGYKMLKSSDVTYLNMFRIFTFLFKTKGSHSVKYMANRLLYFPNVSFKMASIQQPSKIVSNPVGKFITNKDKSDGLNQKGNVRFGLLSLDANKRLFPITLSDDMAHEIPLIGLWIYGMSPNVESLGDDDPEKRILQGILFEYINNMSLVNRYSFDTTKKTLLLGIFSPGESQRFYEVEFMENMENQELENRWIMLKASRDTSNLTDALDYLEWDFTLSPENIITDFTSLKKTFAEMAQNSARESMISTRRIKTSTEATEPSENSVRGSLNMAKKRNISNTANDQSHDMNPFAVNKSKKTNPSNNSLTEYLYNKHNMQQEKYSDDADDEIDNVSMGFQLPKPHAPPHHHFNRNLNESKESIGTASFIPDSEHTFAHDSNKNLLPESAKKRMSNSSNDYQSSQYDSQNHRHSHVSNFGSGGGDSLSPFAEKLLNQQAEQLKFLQDQIMNLQTTLLSYQTSAAQGLLRPSNLTQPQKSTRDVGTDAPDNDFLQNLVKEIQASKRCETKATNTTFSAPKEEMNEARRPTESNGFISHVPDNSMRTNFLANLSNNHEMGNYNNYSQEMNRPHPPNPPYMERPSWMRTENERDRAEFVQAEEESNCYPRNKYVAPTNHFQPSRREITEPTHVKDNNNSCYPPRYVPSNTFYSQSQRGTTESSQPEENINFPSQNNFVEPNQLKTRLLNDITNKTNMEETAHQYPNRPAEIEVQRNFLPSFPKNPHAQLVDISPISSHDASKKENNYDSPLFEKDMGGKENEGEEAPPIHNNNQKDVQEIIKRQQTKKSTFSTMSSNILAPQDNREVSIQVPKIKFQKKLTADSDSEDEEIRALEKKYLSGKV